MGQRFPVEWHEFRYLIQRRGGVVDGQAGAKPNEAQDGQTYGFY